MIWLSVNAFYFGSLTLTGQHIPTRHHEHDPSLREGLADTSNPFPLAINTAPAPSNEFPSTGQLAYWDQICV